MRRVCTVQLGFGCNHQVGGEAVQVNIAHPIPSLAQNLMLTLVWCKTIFGCKYEVDREAVEVNIAHPIYRSKFNADFGAKQYLVA